MTTQTCKNCGNQFTGKFCNTCGEKVYDEHDKRVIHLFEEVFHFIWHVEGTFLVTLKTFLTRPGKFSADFCNGIRRKYFKPVSFFLIFVVLYLIFPRFQGLNMRFNTYVSKDYNYAWYAVPVAKQKVRTLQVTPTQLAERYDKESPAFAKIFLLMLIPLSAVVIMLLFLTSKKFFFDHFILATEINSFYIFSHFLFLPFAQILIVKAFPSAASAFYDGSWIWILMLIVYSLFVIFSFRNFYKQKWWIVILKGLLFVIIFEQVIRYIYGLLLYYLVMLFI